MPSTSRVAETLLIEGPDAIAFAQTQFSSNVSQLATGQWQFSAWLDAQGRVRALFHLARIADDRLLLLLRGGNASVMSDALQRFVFRSKLSLSASSSHTLATAAARPLHTVSHDDATCTFGCGSHSLQIAHTGNGDDDWRLQQIRDGWPWLPEALLNSLLPPALSLYRLHAVAIDKGCYPGQEMVARLHYRGGHKRHLHRVVLSQLATPGAALHIATREVGRLLDVVSAETDTEALAVLGDDVAAQAVEGVLPAFDNGLVMRIDATWPA